MSSPPPSGSPSYSSRRQRTLLLIALLVGLAGLTGVVHGFSLSMSEPFVSQVQIGLEWRALRGAQELSGLAATNPELFNKALDAYAASPDVQAIAIATADQIVTSHGTTASLAPVFAAEPGTVVRGDDWVGSWAATAREAQVDKIAVVVSTRPLADAQARLTDVSRRILSAGAAAAILGALVILWLTRGGRVRDRKSGAREADLDPNLDAVPGPDSAHHAQQLEDLSRELDDRNRRTRLILDHAAQGFITVDLAGRITSERSAVVDRWFGEPPAEPAAMMLASYLSPHGREFATHLAGGLEAICEGVASLQQCLDQMPKRLVTTTSAFDVKYAPLLRDDRPEQILLTFSDITEQVARERKAQDEREQRELKTLAQLITDNRAEFDEFFAEAAGLVAAFDAPSDPGAERSTLRKLKENCAYYGLDTYVELCQRIETTLVDGAAAMSDGHRVALSEGWARVASQLVSRLA